MKRWGELAHRNLWGDKARLDGAWAGTFLEWLRLSPRGFLNRELGSRRLYHRGPEGGGELWMGGGAVAMAAVHARGTQGPCCRRGEVVLQLSSILLFAWGWGWGADRKQSPPSSQHTASGVFRVRVGGWAPGSLIDP